MKKEERLLLFFVAGFPPPLYFLAVKTWGVFIKPVVVCNGCVLVYIVHPDAAERREGYKF